MVPRCHVTGTHGRCGPVRLAGGTAPHSDAPSSPLAAPRGRVRSRVRRIAAVSGVVLWSVVAVVSILGLLAPQYPGAFLLAAGLLTGLIYPFVVLVVAAGVVIAVISWKRTRRVLAVTATVLSLVLVAGIAWPTVGAFAAADRANTQLSAAELFQSAPEEGSGIVRKWLPILDEVKVILGIIVEDCMSEFVRDEEQLPLRGIERIDL